MRAKRALQLRAARLINRAVVDELGALGGARPSEQVADGCQAGWGRLVVTAERGMLWRASL